MSKNLLGITTYVSLYKHNLKRISQIFNFDCIGNIKIYIAGNNCM